MTTQLRLEDKYNLSVGDAFVTGVQALVQLLVAQHRQDRSDGASAGALVTGYQGSPLGVLDMELAAAPRRPRRARDRAPAGGQRRAGGHRPAGFATGGPSGDGPLRPSCRHVVRKGSRPRPGGRRHPPCQPHRVPPHRRRAGRGRRRPRSQVLHPALGVRDHAWPPCNSPPSIRPTRPKWSSSASMATPCRGCRACGWGARWPPAWPTAPNR